MVTAIRGDVILCDLNPVIGTEQAGVRPALVVQIDRANTAKWGHSLPSRRCRCEKSQADAGIRVILSVTPKVIDSIDRITRAQCNRSTSDRVLDLCSSHTLGAVYIEVFSPFKEEYFLLAKAHPCKHALVRLIDVPSD